MQQLPVRTRVLCHSAFKKGTVSCFDSINRAKESSGIKHVLNGSILSRKKGQRAPIGSVRRQHHAN